MDLHVEINSLKAKIVKTRKRIYENLTPWQRAQIVRHPARPYALDYIERICNDFTELHGDPPVS
jgi:acetyl-CoA carboxylase carboxyl transferase subunit alpha